MKEQVWTEDQVTEMAEWLTEVNIRLFRVHDIEDSRMHYVGMEGLRGWDAAPLFCTCLNGTDLTEPSTNPQCRHIRAVAEVHFPSRVKKVAR